MPRFVRIYLLACIALAFGFLVVHAGEPLRLNVGDAWTDASVLVSVDHVEHPTCDPPLPQIIYGIVGKLVGARQITMFRLLALAFSGLAAWLLYQYVRRMWNDTVAIIATALTATSLVWMLFADSLHRPPIMHAARFLALWGVVRVLESGQRRHYLAALGGTFVCLFAASTEWPFLLLGVLFTVYVKGGKPFTRDTWQVLAACAAGGLLAVVLRSPFAAHPSDWQAALDQQVAGTFATLLRRYTALLTPMLWVTLGWAIVRALRVSSIKAAIEDGTTWMLVAALVFAYLPAPRPESATLRTQLLLPLYTIGSALLIGRMFEHGRWLRRALAFAWCAVAPVWGLWLMLSHPREVLARDDLARANEYLAHNDRNGFVLSNLLADGPLVAAFGRHGWTETLSDPDTSSAHLRMLELFESTGTDYAHAVIFTTPGSRFVDRSMTQVMGRRMASVDGWPYLVRAKVNELVRTYDAQVLRSLEAVGAKRVLHLGNFDIYRIDRSTVVETAARSLPIVHRIDFASLAAVKHQLLGWGDAVTPTETSTPSGSIAGYGRCWNPIATTAKPAANGCTVVEVEDGLDVLDVRGISRAELMVRVERVCDQQLTITLGTPARINVVFNGVTILSCGDPQWGTPTASVRVPARDVHLGLNIISLDDAQGEPKEVRPEVTSLAIEPICEPVR